VGNLVDVATATATTMRPLRTRAALVVLSALGLVAVLLCHPHAAPSEASVASPPAAGGTAAHAAPVPDAPHADGHGTCDEDADVVADQRGGSLSASALLGLGVFAFAGPLLPAPRPVGGHRPPRRRRGLSLAGTRALVSLCVRRV
jgi:hypothetical protein